MAEEKTENYAEKFKDLMDEDNVYEFFLKMQNLMPKYSKKKKDQEFFSFVSFIIEHLNKYEEKESISTIPIKRISILICPKKFLNTIKSTFLGNF